MKIDLTDNQILAIKEAMWFYIEEMRRQSKSEAADRMEPHLNLFSLQTQHRSSGSGVCPENIIINSDGTYRFK